MEYQYFINIAVGIITLLGGWVFKMILSTLNEIKKDHNNLTVKHAGDMEKINMTYTNLALSLPEKYVNKEDFKMFAGRLNDRFDRLEEKIDNLKR